MEKENKTQSRRDFFGKIFQISAASLIVSAITPRIAFSNQDQKKKAITTLKIADYDDLKNTGGSVMIKDTVAGDILIVRADENTFNALNPVCPHRQCTVKVKNPEMIQCPCHRSAYQLDGTYISGPSKKSLGKFKVEINNGTLTVTE